MRPEKIRALFEKHCRGIKGKNIFGKSKMTISRSSMASLFAVLDVQIQTKNYSKLIKEDIFIAGNRANKYELAVNALVACWPSGSYRLPAAYGTVDISELDIFMSHIIGITFCGDWWATNKESLARYPDWNDQYYTGVQIAHNNMLIGMALTGYDEDVLSKGVTTMAIILGKQVRGPIEQQVHDAWHRPAPVYPFMYGAAPAIPMYCHESILIMIYACQIIGQVETMSVIQNGSQASGNLHYYCVPRSLNNQNGVALAKEIDQGVIYDLWGYLYDGKPMEGNWIYPHGRPKNHKYHCDNVKVLCTFDRASTLVYAAKPLPMNAKMALNRIG